MVKPQKPLLSGFITNRHSVDWGKWVYRRKNGIQRNRQLHYESGHFTKGKDTSNASQKKALRVRCVKVRENAVVQMRYLAGQPNCVGSLRSVLMRMYESCNDVKTRRLWGKSEHLSVKPESGARNGVILVELLGG